MAQPDLSDHTWTITLKVVDEQGNPVSAAKAGVGFYTNSQPASINGTTDKDGMFVASQTVGPSLSGYLLGLSAEKNGYYTTRSGLNLDFKYDPAQWNPTITLVLKKVSHPIAMYAKSVLNLKLPESNKLIGYDLMMGDWVGPYGKGITKDIIFEKEYYEKPGNVYFSKITISFSKPGDGIQIYTVPDAEKGSDLRSSYEAPAQGYQSQLTRETSALTGQPHKFEYDPNRIYLFRVRTALDESGNVVSAHYGKIYGDFMTFKYYLNPTPSSRNIEFDPKQNLLQGLQSIEQVNEP